jgi:hypothetical protein
MLLEAALWQRWLSSVQHSITGRAGVTTRWQHNIVRTRSLSYGTSSTSVAAVDTGLSRRTCGQTDTPPD